MADETVLSVRGEARRTIEPDFVQLHCGLHAVATSKTAALDLLASVQGSLGEQLAALGGVPLTAATIGQPLTWSTQSISTHPEHDFDKRTGNHGPTGRVVGEAGVLVSVRELNKLASVEQALAGVAELSTDHVSWYVDDTNPAWKEIRAEAIGAAIGKGHDYASALGGAVVRVEQIADTGMLADDHQRYRSPAFAMTSGGGMGPSVPGLDPVPQEISAVIDARLVAEVPPLAR